MEQPDNPEEEIPPDTTTTPIDDGMHHHVWEGTILRKKKRPNNVLVLAVKPVGTKSQPIHVTSDVAERCDFLHLHCIIRVQYELRRPNDSDKLSQHSDSTVMWATDITLLRSTHIPTILPTILKGVVDGRYPVSVIPGATVTDLQAMLDMPVGRKKRIALAELSRTLEGREAYKPPRYRMPFVKNHEWRILDKLKDVSASGEQGWTLQPLTPKQYPDITTASTVTGATENEEIRDANDTITSASNTSTALPLNLPPKPSTPPKRGPRPSREHYMMHKKLPQVRWMVRRVQELYAARGNGHHTIQHILDVGGGRGDLATALALALPTGVRITVVDVNEPSLTAGQAYAASILGNNRTTFVLADMVDFCQQHLQEKNPQKIDLVVALHACGDLSDLAMAFAQQIQADFLVCPCCYGKKHITNFEPGWEHYCTDTTSQAALRRLTELNELPHVSRLAMQYINSMRYQALLEHFDVSLEEYDIQMSIRNHVFAATHKHNNPKVTTKSSLFLTDTDSHVDGSGGGVANRDTDNDTYEALLQKYSRPVRRRSLLQCCADALPVVQQVSLVVWFLARYELAAAWEVAAATSTTTPQGKDGLRVIEERLEMAHAVLLLGFALVVALRLVAPSHTLLTEPSSTTKARHRLTDGGLLGVLIRLLASLLRGLTASYSTDTVQSLSIACMALHLVTCDYTYGASSSSSSPSLPLSSMTKGRRPPFLGGTFSLNAVFVAAVLCSSRLQSNITSYFFCSLAVIMFGFYPATRADLMARYPPHRSAALWWITLAMVASTLVLLDKMSQRRLFGLAVALLLGLFPFWKYVSQSYKRRVHGPWSLPTNLLGYTKKQQ